MIRRQNEFSRSKLAAVAAGVLGLAAAMPAVAADSATVTVNATVLGVCRFTTTTATVTITNGGTGSTIDPSLTGNATGNATLQYKCTRGRTPGFTLSPTSPTTVVCSTGACNTQSMPVSVALSGQTAGQGFGSGTEQTVTVTGTIIQADYVNATEGAYTRNVTVSITP
jgi:hypothetical protein